MLEGPLYPFASSDGYLTSLLILLLGNLITFLMLMQGSLGKNTLSPVPSAAHVRTMRKGSTEHLALNIDSESDRLINNEETDEDKG